LYRADYTLFPSNKIIYKRGSHCIAVVTLIQILSLLFFSNLFVLSFIYFIIFLNLGL
jgi:hypothetical protein